MDSINTYKFTAGGLLSHLKQRIHSDLYQGIEKTYKQIMTILEGYGESRAKIKANLSLSRTGQAEQIEALAKDAYEAIHGMREKSDYQGNIAQLNKRIDNQLKPTYSTDEKLLRQLQMAEIRDHLGRMTDEQVLSTYSNATDIGDALTIEAIESAPSFIFNTALLGPIIQAAQENRRTTIDPGLAGQIWELEKCDSTSRMLFTDAEMILGTETDIISDMTRAETSTEAATAE